MSNRFLHYVLFCLIIVLNNAHNTYACTAFIIKSNEKILLAKNLDWPINDGMIIVNKKGLLKAAHVNSKDKISWVSKYGSISFNQFGKEFPLGGINEMGLIIEELNNWGEVPEQDSIILNEFQLVQFILDNFSSIKEIKNIVHKITVEPVFINLHHLLSDKQGNVAVIEFYNSKLYFYEGEEIEYLVLSNNHYENSIKYIKNFQGFGGNLSIPKTNTSNDRFVKTALLLNKLEDHEKLSKVDYAFQILDSVKQDDTQWSIVYNNDKLTIHFLADGVNRKKIELKDFDFSCNTPIVCYPIKSADIGNISKHFIKYSPEINKELLFTVYKKYKDFQLGSAGKDVFMEFHNYSESIKCKY